MNVKRIELLLHSLLILSLILRLLNCTWITLFLFIVFFGLISTWIYGFLKSHKLGPNGFDKAEVSERLFSVLLVLGVIQNVSEIAFSNLIISLGLLILSSFLIFKGISGLMKKDFLLNLEYILIGLILVGYFFRLKYIPGAGPIRVVCATILSMLYLSMSIHFIIDSIKAGRRTLGIAGMFLYLSLSIYVIAILFDTMFWPGDSIMFSIALLSSIIAFPFLIIKTFKQKETSVEYKLQIRSLYKRFIILFSISLFFAVATPQQFLRFEFGNRPELINSFYDCRLNYDLDDFSRNEACQEFQTLNLIKISGNYPESLSKEDIEILKQEFKNNKIF